MDEETDSPQELLRNLKENHAAISALRSHWYNPYRKSHDRVRDSLLALNEALQDALESVIRWDDDWPRLKQQLEEILARK